MKYPLVSIIILNWNGKIFLKKCLNSVFKLNYPNFEIIVVDNGSTDGSADFVKKNYPKVKLIENKKNLGFAEGNNVGMRDSKGKYVALLNNDTEVDKNWVSELVKAVESDDRIGMCASKVLFYNSNIINSTGLVVFKDMSIRNRGWKEIDIGQYDKTDEVFGAYGAAAIYRKKMLDQIGLIDKDYFIYHEEFDLAWRARLCGWKCFYVPTAVVHHVVDVAMEKYSDLKTYLMHRNRLWCLLKNFSLSSMIFYAPYVLLYELGTIAHSLFRLKSAHLRAIADTFKELPKLLEKRRKIQRMRTVSENEIREFFFSPPYLTIIKRKFSV